MTVGPKGLCFTNALIVLADATAPATPADLRGAPPVPNWEVFADRAVAISHGLFDDLEAALARGAKLAELEAIRKQIEQLGNIVRVAGLVMGYMAPFKPKRRKSGMITFGSTVPADSVKSVFPWIQTAIDFLQKKQVVKASEFSSLSIDQQQAAFTAPGMEDTDQLKKLRDEIAKGQDQEGGGESLAEFRKRIADQVALTRAQTETVFRTNVKQGYVDGFEKGTASGLVSEVFPAVMFSATHDNRVRETHWELDGFICLKTDPAYKVLLRALKDWGCRCSPIPMTMDQVADAGGLKTFADLPPDVVKKYGQGISPTTKPKFVPPAFEPHPSAKMNPRSYTTVVADAGKLDAEWAKDPQNYLPSKGKGASEIEGRRDHFEEFLKKGFAVEQPKVVIGASNVLSFDDGRHRTRVLIDKGLQQIPLSVPKSDAAKIRKLVGVDQPS